MRRLEGMVGEWDVTMTHAWFLDRLDTVIKGSATFEWLADAFSRHTLYRDSEDGSAGWL